jgi:peptidoglycan/xylan/chitin deacetylase (PgdA/CDA1 family)
MHRVCLTFDFDAVSPWIHVDDGRNTPVNRSRGLFGAEVGAPRLLDLLADHDIEATWFTPGHTLDSFPEIAARIHEAGHGIQHHGWSHTRPGDYDSREAERADLERGIESIERVTGSAPTGYRSPSWDFSEHTADLIADLGFEWDSSAMAREFEPYWLHTDEAPGDAPYDRGRELEIVEIPVSWHRDDWPALGHSRGKGVADEAAVFRAWRESFEWMVRNTEAGVFVLTMHPQVIGQAHRIMRLEALIQHMSTKPGVEFKLMDTVAEEWREANPPA